MSTADLPDWITPDLAEELYDAMQQFVLHDPNATTLYDSGPDWEEWVWLHPACPPADDITGETPQPVIDAVALWVHDYWLEVLSNLDEADYLALARREPDDPD